MRLWAIYFLVFLLWQMHTNANFKTRLLDPGAFKVLEWELELAYLLHEAIFTGGCMGGFIWSFWDWLACSPFFVGISIIKMNCMCKSLLNILSNLCANLTTKYYPLFPAVSHQGSRSLPVESLAIPTACSLVGCSASLRGLVILKFFISLFYWSFSWKKYGHLCIML